MGGIFVFLILLDYVLLPLYVSSPEITVPKVIGLKEQDALTLLHDSHLDPIVSDTTYDEKVLKGSVMFQKPETGSVVKKGRRVYIIISGGEPMVTVPVLKGHSMTEAKLSLERVGLKLGNVNEQPSQNPKSVIFDQQFTAGTQLKKGESVGITVSIGPVEEGDITVPDLIGKSLTEAEKLISDSSLTVGKINYQPSFSLLPNTILDQYPSKGNKVNKGAAVDLFVTKSGDDKKIIEE